MSLEISQETIDQVLGSLESETLQDHAVVTNGLARLAVGPDAVTGIMLEELAQDRQAEAFRRIYPVEGTSPTGTSSLKIVEAILLVKELTANKADRADRVAALGGDIALMGAVGHERAARLREKGVLRIFDPQTNRSMWAPEFEDLQVRRAAPQERSALMTAALVRKNSEVRRY
jgi:hypothetical protein